MKPDSIALRVAAIGMLLLVCGCESTRYRLYDGPPRERGDVVVVRELPNRNIRVTSIDGEYVSGKEWEILPGDHSLEATTYIRKRLPSDDPDYRPALTLRVVCELRFSATPGLIYVVAKTGEIEKTGRNFYKYDLAVFVAEESEPTIPIGSYVCGDPKGNVFP